MAVIIENNTDLDFNSGSKLRVEVLDGTLQLMVDGGTLEVPDATNLVPKMTSNTTPSGVASANYNNANAYLAFDGDASTSWDSNNSTLPKLLTYQFSTPQRIVSYGLQGRAAGIPYGWIFQGSNDGTNWVNLDQRSGQNPSALTVYSFSNSEYFNIYRLYITAAQGSPRVISLGMYGIKETPTFYSYGEYESSIIDLGQYFREITSISQVSSIPTNATVEIYTSTSGDYISFTPWEQINSDGTIQSPQQRYIKIKVVLKANTINENNETTDFANMFESNEYVDYSPLKLKTTYNYPVEYQSELSGGSLLSATFDKSGFEEIQNIDITPISDIVTNFSYTGALQSWTVPSGISSVVLEAWGAEGGDSESGTNRTGVGGKGGYSKGRVTVSEGQIINIRVGQQGKADGTSSFNGGGSGPGGGGGGATDFRIDGDSATNRIIVAGGGGGASYTVNGGYGGGLNNYGARGGGAYGGYGGGNGSGGAGSGTGATGGTSTNGGGGVVLGGGGGGGYGGGGGGRGSSVSSMGAGGGGGGYVIASATEQAGANGVRSGNGYARISYTPTTKYLILEDGIIKSYINGQWIEVGIEPVNYTMFASFGMDSLTDLNGIALSQLASDTLNLLVYTSVSNQSSLTLTLSCIPYTQVLIPTSELNYKGALQSLTLTTTESDNGKIRCAVSRDRGQTWMSYKYGSWFDIDINYNAEFLSFGMTPTELNNISTTEWSNFTPTNSLRIAFLLDITSLADTTIINSLSLVSSYGESTPQVSSITINYNELDATYSGLMFMDSTESYYSTSLGEVIRYLDFGTLLAGQTSLDVKILLTNTFPFDVKDVVLSTESNIGNTVIELSKSNAPFVAQQTLLFEGPLYFDQKIEFYVRVRTNENAVGGGNFNIKVKSDVL